MTVAELIQRLAKANPDARINVTLAPDGEAADFDVLGTSDDGDIFDLFIGGEPK